MRGCPRSGQGRATCEPLVPASVETKVARVIVQREQRPEEREGNRPSASALRADAKATTGCECLVACPLAHQRHRHAPANCVRRLRGSNAQLKVLGAEAWTRFIQRMRRDGRQRPARSVGRGPITCRCPPSRQNASCLRPNPAARWSSTASLPQRDCARSVSRKCTSRSA